jgi:hypothetical protein
MNRCFLMLLVFAPIVGFSQKFDLSLTITSFNNKPVSSASIIIETAEDILGYGFSDNDGNLKLNITKNKNDSLFARITSVGYEKYYSYIPNPYTPIRIQLKESNELLKDVVISARPEIKVSNDTIRYETIEFSNNKDRTIGDVLDKMPGLTVMENGAIYYNGKLVKNIIIDGEDVTQGAYGILTKAVHHKYIKTVEVINNFQDIKMLQNKFKTGDIVINLKLENRSRIIISGELNAGLGLPDVVDANLKSVIFNQIIKAVNVINFNNTGYNLASNFVYEEQGDAYRTFDYNMSSLVSLGAPSNPISDKQANRNQSLGFNLDDLFHINQTNTINLNLKLNSDRNDFDYYRQQFYTVDAVRIAEYTETQNILNKLKGLKGSILYKNNASKFYMSNALSLGWDDGSNLSNLNLDSIQNSQFISNVKNRVVNKFRILPKMPGTDILSFELGVKAERLDNDFSINHGIFKEKLNAGKDYDSLFQSASPYNLLGSIRLDYFKSTNPISQKYSLKYDRQKLTFPSGISLFNQGDVEYKYLDAEKNITSWNQDKITFIPSYTYQIPRTYVSLSLPITFLNIDFKDKLNNSFEDFKKLYFTGDIMVQKSISYEDRLYLNVSRKYSSTDPFTFRNTDFISSFRQLNIGINTFYYNYAHDASLRYQLGRSLQFFYSSIYLQYTLYTSNTLMNAQLNETGVVNSIQEIKNSQSSYTGGLSVDKYLYNIKFRIRGELNASYYPEKILLNDNYLHTALLVYSPAITLNKRFGKILELKYKGQFDFSSFVVGKNQISTLEREKSTNIKHEFNANINYRDLTVYSNVSGLHLFSSQIGGLNQYFLWDVGAKYLLGKSDLVVECNNLANVKNVKFINYANGYSEKTDFRLRGRYILIKYIYYFSI